MPAFLLHYLLRLSHTKHWPITALTTGVFNMNDLNQNTAVNVDNVEPMKAEFTPDDLRVELDKLQNKLRVSEEEVEAERNRANSALKKTQKITEGIFALLEPEILAAFQLMVDEAIRDVDERIETALDESSYVDSDDIDERISDAIGDSSFDAAVRDAVREMINDGDISISIENIELSLDT